MTDLREILAAATQGPWAACKEGACSCGIIWSIPHDHPVATAQETPWGDFDYVAAPTEEDPEAVERRFLEYGAFPESEFLANARLIALAPDLAAALLKAEEALAFYVDENRQGLPSDGPWGLGSDDFGKRARAALSNIKNITGGGNG
jgi:hypothetical protein